MSDDIPLPLLQPLAARYPTTDAALAEIGYLEAVRALPKGTVHVLSDVHGEDRKLKHVVNNASGTLRTLVERMFGTADSAGSRDLLGLIYYPREAYAFHAGRASSDASQGFDRRAFLVATLSREIEVIRELSRRSTLRHAERLFPHDLAGLFRELIAARDIENRRPFVEALLEPFIARGRDVDLLRAAAHVIRNLSVAEIVVAGDLGDRGPRLDRVVDLLMRQPSVRVVWGNHDASWMGACLGQEALIATVLRISVRYRRLSQLEEGFGLTIAPLEKLARTVYGDDPVEQFRVKGKGLRDDLSMARMQKAIAILQFKLEGQTSRRRPEYGLSHRQLLHRIALRDGAGTVTIDDKTYPLLDTRFPTIDFAGDPYALSAEERVCMDRLAQSFRDSAALWRAMTWVERQGSMLLRREPAVIFHGCVPVDEAGDFKSMIVDGEPRAGRALFDAYERKIRRAFAKARTRVRFSPEDATSDDVDALWYLWTGPLSPCFGKDRMATFEGHFVADKATHEETKDPYFKKIHEVEFCSKVCAELGGDRDRGLIVNGHVPVKIEAGESPVKKSKRAVTIDGAFSEAYGDKGYTLILEASRTALAQHHHFDSIEEAVAKGADVIPTVMDIETYDRPRTVAETEQGEAIRAEIAVLEALVRAYEENRLPEG